MNWNKWGPFLQGSMQIIQPIFTFGQIDSYQKAATGQLNAKSELADVKRNEIVYTTKEFYYSYLMATDLLQLVDDTVKFLEEASTTAEKNLEDEDAKTNIKPHDLYKLKNALEDLRQKQLYAKQGRQTAEKAVSWITVTNFSELKERTLSPEAFEKKDLDYYLKLAHAKRPEFRALAAGQEARAALRDAKRAQSYPAIFIGAFGSAGWSPVTDKQNSMFANDPYNRITGGAGMGIKFDLDIWKHEGEAHEQEAELMKLKATESWAVPGIELEVKKAFWELEQWFDGLEVAKRRRDLTKKWFVSSAMGWSVGLTAAKDLLEALEGNALAKKNYVETVFSLNMALAKLSQAVGQELTGLKYR
jgi:outer membrane protein